MINIVILLGSCFIYGQINAIKQTQSCEVCIVSSMCTDDTIYFNVSISKYCQNPLNTVFSYHTDVNTKHRHYRSTATCIDCHINVEIDAELHAWDYTLILVSPKPSERCPSKHTVHCGGKMSQIIWFVTGGMAGLFVIIGVIFCCFKYCRVQKRPAQPKVKKIEVALINT